ncbi:Serine/threonine kinase [Fusarium falciforme]|nr:Serine/threonine kinase [Fusarium falciforme]
MGNGQGKPADLNGEVSLNHFRLLRVVGRGAFGKVRIVNRKDTNLYFALKYVRKNEVVRSKSVRNIIRERRMLEYLNHSFICNLRYSFQDIEYIDSYLVVDLMTGGDLRFHISRKTLTEEAVRFWIAELGCALRYIHSQNIIHRDIKPDNVLLDADGHNVASDVVAGRTLTSKSGTLAYLAPEVYAGKGYDVRADWWSLGVLFYECIYNKRPFVGGSKGSLSSQIQTANPKYPVTQPPVSLACLHAIGSALDPNRDTRMGSTWDSFANHEFFKVFDFELLEQKRIEPIFVPCSHKTNFDGTYEMEELLFEAAPLEARARRQKPRERLKEDATDKEIRDDELHRMIETDFRPFDYTVVAYKKITEAAQGLNDEAQPDLDSALQAVTTDETTPMPAPSPWYQNNFRNHHHPIITGKRVTSPTRGVQVTLDGGGSWSELARQDATLPTDANNAAEDRNEGSGGVFGFLKSKKRRNHSPNPKERGVLGKKGARIVIG